MSSSVTWNTAIASGGLSFLFRLLPLPPDLLADPLIFTLGELVAHLIQHALQMFSRVSSFSCLLRASYHRWSSHKTISLLLSFSSAPDQEIPFVSD